MKDISKERKFIEAIEVVFKMGVDPKQGDQNIRGTCILPSGIGKEIKVAVIADKERQSDVMLAGADIFVTDAILKEMGEGIYSFDKLIATPEQM